MITCGSTNGAKHYFDMASPSTNHPFISFRRKRFHWPAEAAECHLDSPAAETPKSALHRHSMDSPWRQRAPSVASAPLKAGTYSRADLDLIRSIQVFSAKKVNDQFFPLA